MHPNPPEWTIEAILAMTTLLLNLLTTSVGVAIHLCLAKKRRYASHAASVT